MSDSDKVSIERERLLRLRQHMMKGLSDGATKMDEWFVAMQMLNAMIGKAGEPVITSACQICTGEDVCRQNGTRCARFVDKKTQKAEPAQKAEALTYHLFCWSCGESWWSFEPFPVMCPFCRVSRHVQEHGEGVRVVGDGEEEYATKKELAAVKAELHGLHNPDSVKFPFREELEALRTHVAELEHGHWNHCSSDLAHGGKGKAKQIDDLRGEVAALSDQIGMHCKEPHGLGSVTPPCVECAEVDCKHEAKPEPCTDFQYRRIKRD